MSLAPQVGLELTALRLTGNRMMVRSTIPTKSSRPLSPVALPAPAPSVNLVTPELLTAPADALHHHDEQDLPLSHPPIQHTRQPSMRSPRPAWRGGGIGSGLAVAPPGPAWPPEL